LNLKSAGEPQNDPPIERPKEMISKDQLTNNVSYMGIHEDTAVAKWASAEQAFWYVSIIDAKPFLVRLQHPEDGGSFTPIGRLYGQGDTNTVMRGCGKKI
jgi:hypothetical protein